LDQVRGKASPIRSDSELDTELRYSSSHKFHVMANMAQTLGQLPVKSSIISEIFSSEIASVFLGILIFYFVQTRWLSRWSPSTKKGKAANLVDKTAKLSAKGCDSPILSFIALESEPGPTQSPITPTNESTDGAQKSQKMASFFVDRQHQRQSHIQNFRPKEASSSANVKSASNDAHKAGSFFADRQQHQRRQDHIQNFRPPTVSHRSSLGPTGPPPGLEGMLETTLPNSNDALERRSRLGRRSERRASTTVAATTASDPLAESLGCTGLNGNEGALIQLWSDVMSMPKKDTTSSTPGFTQPGSSAAPTVRGRTRTRPNDRKRF